MQKRKDKSNSSPQIAMQSYKKKIIYLMAASWLE